MKISKKILAGLLALFLLVGGLVFALPPQKVLADPVDNASFTEPVYVITGFEDCDGERKPRTMNVTIAGESFTFTDQDPCDDIVNLKTPFNVRYQTFLCDQEGQQGINLTGSGDSWSGHIFVEYMDDTDDNCASGNGDSVAQRLAIRIQGQPGVDCEADDPNCSCTGEGDQQVCTSEAADDNSRCVDAGSTLMEWFLCPLTTGIGGAVDQLNGWIEDLLTIDMDFFSEEVKEVWSAIRIIATSVLVIVMLVMIVSQAIGRGPFA